MLPEDFASNADRLGRFEQEAKTLAALIHPNILTVHDAGVHEGAPYLVSELLRVKTLREEMNGAALPVRKATDYALQIAQGLAAAHGKGVVHRDLKPENIFGNTIYYVAAGSRWSVPGEGGSPRKIRDADGIATDPRGEYLLIQVNQPDGTQLVRFSLSGDPETILQAQYPLVNLPISPHSIGPDGRVALQVAPVDSWYWAAAILDPKTGKMELMPEDKADMDAPSWDDQGRVVVAAHFLRSSLWRFRPDK